ncbi:ABC transporter ATP-binding protein [Leptospira perolatii]|uniref:ABC transporter ATP-binding protein n=1 Tax=Leptospira perolatii TaxID=2023191 RepID=UPI001A9C860F|nr:ABC transporter ATP-binding protein [Leptospira perolatii]
MKNVSFSVFSGETMFVKGRNGAGKTTLLRSILHHKKWPEQFQFRGSKNPRISYLGHELGLYTTLSLEENLEYFRRIAGASHSKEQIESWLREFRLWGRRFDPVSTFSRGMKQKSALIRALLSKSDLYMLDEPFTALDSDGVKIAKEIVRSIGKSSALILVTHDANLSLELPEKNLILGEETI